MRMKYGPQRTTRQEKSEENKKTKTNVLKPTLEHFLIRQHKLELSQISESEPVALLVD